MIDLRLAPRHRVEPSAIRISRHNKPLHSLPFIIRTPEVAPVMRTLHILIVEFRIIQSFCHLGNTPVIIAILHGTIAGTVYSIRNIAQRVIFHQSTSAMLFLRHTAHKAIIIGWRHFGILDHRLQRQFIIDTLHSFGKGISYDNICIAASLRSTVPVAASSIWHITVILVDIEQGIDHIPLLRFLNQGKQRHGSTVSIPDGIVIVIIRRSGEMRVFTRLIHRHQHRMINGCIKHPLLLFGTCDFYLSQLLVPGFPHILQLGIEAASRNILPGLGDTDMRNTNLQINGTFREGNIQSCL